MSDLVTTFYVPICEWLRGRGRSVREVQTYHAELNGREVHESYMRTRLNEWTDVGALRKVKAEPESGGRRTTLYVATALALEPAMLARVGAGPELPEAPQGALEPVRRPALAVIREPEPEPVQQPFPGLYPPASPRSPSTLFTGEFRPDGVLITYEQFHYVIALLQFMEQEQGAKHA